MTNAVRADEALHLLVEGNARFQRGEARFTGMRPDALAKLAKGQRPFATILGCSTRASRPSLSSMQFSANYLSFALQEMSCRQRSRAVCSMRAPTFGRPSLSSSGIRAAGLSMQPWLIACAVKGISRASRCSSTASCLDWLRLKQLHLRTLSSPPPSRPTSGGPCGRSSRRKRVRAWRRGSSSWLGACMTS